MAHLRHHVRASSELGILELSHGAETRLLERPDSPFIRNRGPDACEANEGIRPQAGDQQVERSRTQAATQELRLADEQVDVHEAPWKVCQARRLQFVLGWRPPADVADKDPVRLDQRAILDRPSRYALPCRPGVSPPARHVRSLQPVPEDRRVSAWIEGLESDLTWRIHDGGAAEWILSPPPGPTTIDLRSRLRRAWRSRCGELLADQSLRTIITSGLEQLMGVEEDSTARRILLGRRVCRTRLPDGSSVTFSDCQPLQTCIASAKGPTGTGSPPVSRASSERGCGARRTWAPGGRRSAERTAIRG